MGRPREFDTDIAIEKAMTLFWDVGYEEASMANLLNTMEITKGSFYKAFGDKRSVYLDAIDKYDAEVVNLAVTYLQDPANGTGYERILFLFDKTFINGTEEERRRGCFLCNAMVDQAAHNQVIQARLNAMAKKIEDAVTKALRDPNEDGTTLTEKEARKRARASHALFIGMRVLGRLGITEEEVKDTREQLKQLLCRKPAGFKQA